MRASVVKRATLTKKRRNVAILRCKDGNTNLKRGRAVLTDLHLRGAVHAKKRAGVLKRVRSAQDQEEEQGRPFVVWMRRRRFFLARAAPFLVRAARLTAAHFPDCAGIEQNPYQFLLRASQNHEPR